MAKMNSEVMKDFQEKPIFFKIKWKIIKNFKIKKSYKTSLFKLQFDNFIL